MSVQNMAILAVAKEFVILATNHANCFVESWNAYISKKYTNICFSPKTPRSIVSFVPYDWELKSIPLKSIEVNTFNTTLVMAGPAKYWSQYFQYFSCL